MNELFICQAKQELEQLKAGDPLPLRRAKINQEATVRKSEKARKHAQEEAARAAAALAEAEAKTRDAEAKTAAAEQAVSDVRFCLFLFVCFFRCFFFSFFLLGCLFLCVESFVLACCPLLVFYSRSLLGVC